MCSPLSLIANCCGQSEQVETSGGARPRKIRLAASTTVRQTDRRRAGMQGASLFSYGNQSGGRMGGAISRKVVLPAFAPCSSMGIAMLPLFTPSSSHAEARSNRAENVSSSLAAFIHCTDTSASFAGASKASSGDSAARSLVLRRPAAAQWSCAMARSSQPEATWILRAARIGRSAARLSVASMTRWQALIMSSEDSIARRVRR